MNREIMAQKPTLAAGLPKRFAMLAALALSAARGPAAEPEGAPPPALAPAPAPISFIKQWGEFGTEPGQFDIPVGIAISPAGEVFITDHYNARIQKFNADGQFLAQFATPPAPGGIALDNAGNLVVSHFAATKPDMGKGIEDRIVVYSPAGEVLREWGRKGTAEGEFDCPAGIAVAKDGRIYVADQTNHRVQVFTGAGKFLLKWGEYGNDTGQFGGKSSRISRTGGPQFIALDAAENVWTTEGANGRVQKFTPDGQFLLAWGDNENKPGSFGGTFAGFAAKAAKAGEPPPPSGGLQGPIALCFDARGMPWTTAVCGRVQQFTPEGNFIRGLTAEQGDGPGQFYAPHQLALDSRGDLYVVDTFNHRVQKFSAP